MLSVTLINVYGRHNHWAPPFRRVGHREIYMHYDFSELVFCEMGNYKSLRRYGYFPW